MENKRLQEELNKVKEEKLTLEKDLGQKNITIQILTETNLSLHAEILEMKQELKRKEDVEKQLEAADGIITKLSESKNRC